METVKPLFSKKLLNFIITNYEKDPSNEESIYNILLSISNNYHDHQHKKMISMIDIRKDENEEISLSFLPVGKNPEYNESGKWVKSNRQSGKIGKVINTVINQYNKITNSEYNVHPTQIEELVNEIKGIQKYHFELVKGSDIQKFYNGNNYYSITGSLGNSCMRYDECQDYFSMYCLNPDCEMLIVFKIGQEDMGIVGRALVWNYQGAKYVDRKYVTEDHIVNSMIDYIRSNHWNYKSRDTYDNCYNNYFMVYNPDFDDYELQTNVILRFTYPVLYDQYPYCDTLKYLNDEKYEISNCHDEYAYILNETDGGPISELYCSRCGNPFHRDDLFRTEDDSLYCNDCCSEDIHGDVYNIDDLIICESDAGEVYVCENDTDYYTETSNGCFLTLSGGGFNPIVRPFDPENDNADTCNFVDDTYIYI